MTPGSTVELEGYTVSAAAAINPVPSLAYRIEEGAEARPVRRGESSIDGDRMARFRRPSRAGDSVRVGSTVVHPSDVMGPSRPGRSVVYSGDTAPSEEIRRLAHRATVLIHEATVNRVLEAEANEWGHSSARQAAELANAAEVSTLFLTHFSARYKDLEPLESEARILYPGSLRPGTCSTT